MCLEQKRFLYLKINCLKESVAIKLNLKIE